MASPSLDKEQAFSNKLTIIFGVISTFLAFAAVLTGIFQYRQLSRTAIVGQDVEMQKPAPKREDSALTLVTDTRVEANCEAHAIPIRGTQALLPAQLAFITTPIRRRTTPATSNFALLNWSAFACMLASLDLACNSIHGHMTSAEVLRMGLNSGIADVLEESV